MWVNGFRFFNAITLKHSKLRQVLYYEDKNPKLHLLDTASKNNYVNGMLSLQTNQLVELPMC